jgi:hypothetical protein
MGGPDAAAGNNGIERDPRYASTPARRAGAVKQADRCRAREQTHRSAECDQTPIMLVRETVKNLIHCRSLFHPALDPAEMDGR